MAENVSTKSGDGNSGPALSGPTPDREIIRAKRRWHHRQRQTLRRIRTACRAFLADPKTDPLALLEQIALLCELALVPGFVEPPDGALATEPVATGPGAGQ